MNNDIATDPRAIVDILARDGVVKIDGFLAQDALKAIRAELETVRASLGEVPTPPPQRGPSLYPTSMLVHGRLRGYKRNGGRKRYVAAIGKTTKKGPAPFKKTFI